MSSEESRRIRQKEMADRKEARDITKAAQEEQQAAPIRKRMNKSLAKREAEERAEAENREEAEATQALEELIAQTPRRPSPKPPPPQPPLHVRPKRQLEPVPQLTEEQYRQRSQELKEIFRRPGTKPLKAGASPRASDPPSYQWPSRKSQQGRSQQPGQSPQQSQSHQSRTQQPSQSPKRAEAEATQALEELIAQTPRRPSPQPPPPQPPLHVRPKRQLEPVPQLTEEQYRQRSQESKEIFRRPGTKPLKAGASPRASDPPSYQWPSRKSQQGRSQQPGQSPQQSQSHQSRTQQPSQSPKRAEAEATQALEELIAQTPRRPSPQPPPPQPPLHVRPKRQLEPVPQLTEEQYRQRSQEPEEVFRRLKAGASPRASDPPFYQWPSKKSQQGRSQQPGQSPQQSQSHQSRSQQPGQSPQQSRSQQSRQHVKRGRDGDPSPSGPETRLGPQLKEARQRPQPTQPAQVADVEGKQASQALRNVQEIESQSRSTSQARIEAEIQSLERGMTADMSPENLARIRRLLVLYDQELQRISKIRDEIRGKKIVLDQALRMNDRPPFHAHMRGKWYTLQTSS
jgi:hypothetical protein